MANSNINIKLTSEQKIEQLKSGKPVYADSFLDTSEGKHLYDVTDKTLQAFLKTQEVVRVSATELSKLYETGFRSFEDQIKYLEDQRNKINTALKTATESEKKSLIEDGKKVEESLKSVIKFKDASDRKAPIGTAVHKLLEMAVKKEIDLSNEEAALVAINKRLNLQKGSLPELSAIYNPKDRDQNSFRYAIRAAKSLSSLMSEAQMVGGQAEKARTALIPANGKIYMISGTSDWDAKGRLGDYKTTSVFDPTHNMIQTVVNAFLKRMESGDLDEVIAGQVLHLPLTAWGGQKSGGSIYKVQPGTYKEDLGFIMGMIDVMEGKKKREDVHVPGSYSSTAIYTTEESSRGQLKGTKYAGEWMSSWLKRDPQIVEDMLANLDQKSREKFIRSLFSMGDSGYYRTGNTADFLRNKYAKGYFSNSSLSQMQKYWGKDQYKDVIAKVIEEKAEQDPGIIYGLIYGNRDYGSISDEFYDWVKTTSKKTSRYLDLVSGLGSLGSGQTPTEEEKQWLDQGRSKYQKWQPDVFELAEAQDVARLEQAEGEIKELPSQREVEKSINELISFVTYYSKIIDLVHKYMEQSGIVGDEEYESKMIESFLAKRETEMGYQGGYEKFVSSKELYNALMEPKKEKIRELQELVEEAKDRLEKEDTQENRDALISLVKELEEAQSNERNITLREIMALLQQKASSIDDGKITDRERKTLNKLDYYKRIGYWSMISDIYDKRMSYFSKGAPQFTYSSDIQKLLEQPQNVEEFIFEKQKKEAANKLLFPEDERRQKKELERRFKKHQEELDAATPAADILTPEQFTVSEILDKIQNEYFGTKIGRTIIDTPQIDKIRNVLIENIINQGESFEDFLSDVKSGEKLNRSGFGWMRKLFSSEGFVGFEEKIDEDYDRYMERSSRARETEIDEKAMSRATSDIKKRIQRVSILNQNMSGLEDFFQKEIQERIEKEKEFKEPGENWWYQIQPDTGESPKWFRTSQDMSKYLVKGSNYPGAIVSGSLGKRFYSGELIQTSRTRPWATYYEGHDPYSDSFDVMRYDVTPDISQKIEKNEEISDNLSDIISEAVAEATEEVADKKNVSQKIAEKTVEKIENNEGSPDLAKKRSDAAKRGWETRRRKQSFYGGSGDTLSSISGVGDHPVHVIVDGTTKGDFTDKKKVAEMWDSEGRLISYITKEINKRTSDKPRGASQLDVIKQIKEDTGKVVDMMASQPPATGGSDLPSINEPPSGGGFSSKGDGDKEKSPEKALKSEYIKYLKEKYDLLIKIDNLEHKQEQAEARKEDVTGIRKDIKILKNAEKSIETEMMSDRFSGLSEDETIKKAEDIQKHRRQSKANTLGVGDAEDTLNAFEKYATKRMKLESEIEQAQLKASTTVGNEKKAWENVVALKQQSLKESEDTYEILKKQAVGVDKNRAKEIIDAVDQQKAILSAQKFAGNRGNRTIFDVIKSDIQRATMRITDFGLAARVLNTARKEIQQVYQNILKLDEAMTNLRIVTGSNTEQAKSMMNTYNDLAMQLGTTTQAVAQSAAEWLRQGYSVSEANELIKSSTYLSRLGFMDMGQSVTALTSVMKGFRIEATDSMDIVDKLTQLDAKYATTAGDIATALSRTSAVAREAGLDLDQTAAALTTMIDVSQQDASSVGNAFRTILARYGNVKATAFTSLVGDSEDIDDANGSINDTEKVLGAIGIKIRSSSSDMRDFDDVMDELADKWVTLTDVEKNAVSTALAGVRQRNIFGIYMENYSTYKQAISEAEKAQGTAARKMQAYNESVAYSINQLSAAWEGFTQKLEASGAVKFFFNSLTAIIENLDHILQYFMPVIATFNADKIVSLAKFLSPLITVPFKAIRHPIDTVKKSHGAFYENMAQKMTAENTNAIEELTNATKDNTAALRGEKSKSGNGGRAGENVHNKARAKRIRPGSIQDLQNQIDIGEQGVQIFKESGLDEDSPQIKKIRARQEEFREQILKKQERSARLQTGVASGLAAGAVRLANKGASAFDNLDIMGWTPFKGAGDVEVSGGEAFAMGVAQGALTGVATAFMGPAGAVLASIVGDALSSLWKKLAHADEIDRKQRVEDAKKQLETIKGISTAVTGLIDLRKKGDTSLWDADDWKQANEYVESLEKARNSSVGFKDALNDAIEGLGNYTLTIEKLTENQETLAKVEAARIKYEAEQTYAAGAQDRYTLLKEIEDAQKKLTSNNEDERKQAQATIKANRAAIQEYTDELNKAYMKSAFYSSGVSTMSQAQKNTASLERLIVEMAEEAEKAAEGKTDEKFFEDDGTLKSEYRSKFIQQLREQGGYEAVLTESEKSVADYKKAMGTVAKLTDKDGKKLSMTLSDLKKLVSSKGGMAKLEYLLGKTGDEFDRIVDQINSADDGKIATIAHSLNMTVEEFEKANKNGDFNFFTTGMAVENLDAFIDRIDKLNGYLAELATNGKLSAESLENVVKNYAFLMQGDDGSFGAENILDNLAELYAEGSESTIAQALAGKFQKKAVTDETWWNAWTQSASGKEFIEKDPLNTTFTSFSDAMASMDEKEQQSYIDYVKSLFATDLNEEIQEKLIEWQTKAYETEISNLESIRDSLDDVNKQREKELELIKAKEALENASKEKKRVYRAGVGFVYTTDQEAVKSAQEKVDELERQQDKDNIQYQIDSLQQQKEILENLENNKQLENLTGFVEKIQNALGEDGSNLFNSILTKDGKFRTNMVEIIANGITNSAGEVKKEEEIKATEEAKEKYVKAGQEYDEFMRKNGSILSDINNPAYTSTRSEWLGKVQNLQEARSAYNKASKIRPAKDVSDIKKGWENVNTDLYKEKVGSQVGVFDDSFNWGQLAGSTAAGIVGGTIARPGIGTLLGLAAGGAVGFLTQLGKLTTGADIYMSEESPEAKGEALSKNMSKDGTYIIGRYGENGEWKFEKLKSNDISEIKKDMKPYNILIHDFDSPLYKDRAVFMDRDENFRWVNANDGALYGADWSEVLGLASGTLSAPGGRTLINENGLESIITPQGTITSLPAKSGIVPADLTRNLWALGEVAPNLIARLGGNSLQTNNSNSSTDNSINIQNLDATFYTEEGFDGEAFLRDLKSQVILTSNNH